MKPEREETTTTVADKTQYNIQEKAYFGDDLRNQRDQQKILIDKPYRTYHSIENDSN